jgi:thiamine kinase-like enzyme
VVPGTSSNGDNPEQHRQAGAWLAQLHSLPHLDDDPLPPAAALIRRWQAWRRRADDRLASSLLTSIDQALDSHHHHAAAQRVPCHRDFTPANWLITADHDFGVIDFEHARADLWLSDCARLANHHWPQQPACATAFWAGYGRQLQDGEHALLAVLAAIEGCAAWSWAVDHGDSAFAARAYAALATNVAAL